MKILQVVAVMAIIALVAGLGARTIMTGMSIANENRGDNSEQVKMVDSSDSDSGSDSDYEKSEPTNVNEVQYLNIVDEGESKSSGGGGGGDSEDNNEEDESIQDLCSSDSDCPDDGNPATIDACRECIYDETHTRKECVHVQPNLYGQVVDAEKGTALNGVNVSIYNNSKFDIFTGEGNYSSLVPKENPDAVSDGNGTYGMFVDPENSYHMVMQGSDEKEFDINITSRSASMSNNSIILPEDGHIKVYFEKASAALKSDLYINFTNGTSKLLIEKSNVGQAVYLNDTLYNEGTEIKFHINVDGSPWSRLRNNGYSSYNHSSDSKYCQVERVDLDTWRLHFEDLPDWWTPDWDFNDAVVLVDIVNASTGNSSNQEVNDNDCDNDGIVNWLDYNDSECDFGEEN
ncbi:hypothetical protein GF378_00400, partial [Candidatus Pacearchaeota archaeon]|nr:hypothetical protein [Candidatus Pacearchaeota archaeon]